MARARHWSTDKTRAGYLEGERCHQRAISKSRQVWTPDTWANVREWRTKKSTEISLPMHGSSINRLDRLENLISLKQALPTGNHPMLMWLPTWTSIRFNHNRLAKRMTRSQRHNRVEALKCSVGKPSVFALSPSHFFPEDVEHSHNVPQRLFHVDVPKHRCNRHHLHDAGTDIGVYNNLHGWVCKVGSHSCGR